MQQFPTPLPNPDGGAHAPVAIVIPMLNEAVSLPRLLRNLAALHPSPDEVIAVDGGSTDGSLALAQAGGLRVISFATRGRPAQINHGVREVTAPHVVVLHADTILPDDAMTVVVTALADPRVALAGFTAIICGAETVRWGTTFHNWIKTWYVPLLFRPHLFFKGARLLFGDHAMFFRRADFLAVGGCDESLTVMEDADLCQRLVRRGARPSRQPPRDDLRPAGRCLGRAEGQLDLPLRRCALGPRPAQAHRAALSRRQVTGSASASAGSRRR